MKNLKCLLIFLLVSFTIPFIQAQNQLNEKQLKQLNDFVDKVMQEWDVPAIGLGIVKDDQVVLAKGYGYRNVEKQLAADENTLFAIGSSTKAFTALGVCQLSDDGLLELDDPVVKYLPDFRMWDDYVTMHITPRDLLCHRSGLPRHDLLWYGSPDSRATLFSKLRYLEPSAGFREVFQYQNLMFMTAGYLTGQLRNSTWEAEMKKRIFEPLEMNRTNLSVESSKKDANHALPYGEEDKKLKAIPMRNIDAVGPAGSINSSPREMCNWLIMNLNGGEFEDKQIVSSSMITACHAPTMTVAESWAPFLAFDNGNGPIAYGMGWFISTHKGRKLVEHGGTIDGFRTSVGMLPEEKVGVVVFANKNGSSLPQIIRNFVLDLMLEEAPFDWNAAFLAQQKDAGEEEEKEDKNQVKETNPSHQLADFEGTFKHPGYGNMKISAVGDSLQLNYHDKDIMLHHYHYDVFQTKGSKLDGGKFVFHFDQFGEIHSLHTTLEPSLDPIIFEKVPENLALAAEKLDEMLGDYELNGVKIRVWKKGVSTLMMTVPGQPDYTLQAAEENLFKITGLDGYSVSFEWKDEQVKAIVLDQPNGVFTAKKTNK